MSKQQYEFDRLDAINDGIGGRAGGQNASQLWRDWDNEYDDEGLPAKQEEATQSLYQKEQENVSKIAHSIFLAFGPKRQTSHDVVVWRGR